MRAGALRQRIRVEQPSDVRDSGGGWTRTWSLLDVVYAEFSSEGAGEPVEGNALTSTINHTVRIRYRTGVTPSMRVVTSDDRTFRILTVVDPDGKKKELLLTCVEKVGDEVA